jgi:hypothetical protein
MGGGEREAGLKPSTDFFLFKAERKLSVITSKKTDRGKEQNVTQDREIRQTPP